VTTAWLDGYHPAGETESADVALSRQLIAAGTAAWARDTPLHLTASALVVHPASGRVLLRWHQRQGAWLQVGGHGDPGESDPLAIAMREAREETGLTDLVPWPDARIWHVVICDVAPGKGEPPHQHADVRYFMATEHPDATWPETPGAVLRWLTIEEARGLIGGNNLRITLDRAEQALGQPR
jgi:8-oxo-dGTP pyrophosphatase MutT (NUDIX family)